MENYSDLTNAELLELIAELSQCGVSQQAARHAVFERHERLSKNLPAFNHAELKQKVREGAASWLTNNYVHKQIQWSVECMFEISGKLIAIGKDASAALKAAMADGVVVEKVATPRSDPKLSKEGLQSIARSLTKKGLNIIGPNNAILKAAERVFKEYVPVPSDVFNSLVVRRLAKTYGEQAKNTKTLELWQSVDADAKQLIKAFKQQALKADKAFVLKFVPL